jgi:hypothetical protein
MTPGDMRDSIALSVSLPLCSFEDVYKEHSPFMIQSVSYWEFLRVSV